MKEEETKANQTTFLWIAIRAVIQAVLFEMNFWKVNPIEL